MSAYATAAASQQGFDRTGRGSAHKYHPRAFVYNTTGTIVPAPLEIVDTGNGGSRLNFNGAEFLLPYPYFVGPSRRLLLVELGNPNVTVKHSLWSGIRGCSVLGRTEAKCVVQVKEGEVVTIFSPDGMVSQLKFDDIVPTDRAFKFNLKPEEAFKYRLQWVEEMLQKTREMPEGNDKINKECRALHELASMVGMSKRFPELRTKIISFVCERNAKLRQSVFEHFGRMCAEVGDIDAWKKIHALQKVMEGQAGSNITEPNRPLPPARRGPPAYALVKKAARRQRDREAYENKMKANPKRNDDSNGGRGKKK